MVPVDQFCWYLALPRGAQWRPVSSVEMSIGDPLEAAGYRSCSFLLLGVCGVFDENDEVNKENSTCRDDCAVLHQFVVRDSSVLSAGVNPNP